MSDTSIQVGHERVSASEMTQGLHVQAEKGKGKQAPRRPTTQVAQLEKPRILPQSSEGSVLCGESIIHCSECQMKNILMFKNGTLCVLKELTDNTIRCLAVRHQKAVLSRK